MLLLLLLKFLYDVRIYGIYSVRPPPESAIIIQDDDYLSLQQFLWNRAPGFMEQIICSRNRRSSCCGSVFTISTFQRNCTRTPAADGDEYDVTAAAKRQDEKSQIRESERGAAVPHAKQTYGGGSQCTAYLIAI
jgi:hypothetical protein